MGTYLPKITSLNKGSFDLDNDKQKDDYPDLHEQIESPTSVQEIVWNEASPSDNALVVYLNMIIDQLSFEKFSKDWETNLTNKNFPDQLWTPLDTETGSN